MITSVIIVDLSSLKLHRADWFTRGFSFFWHINNKFVWLIHKNKNSTKKKRKTHENIYSLNVCGKGRFVSHTVKLNGSIALQFSIFIQREILFVSFIFISWFSGPLNSRKTFPSHESDFFSFLVGEELEGGKENTLRADNCRALYEVLLFKQASEDPSMKSCEYLCLRFAFLCWLTVRTNVVIIAKSWITSSSSHRSTTIGKCLSFPIWKCDAVQFISNHFTV